MTHHNINNIFHSIDIPDDFNSPSSSDYEIDREYDYLNYSERFTNENSGAEMNYNYNEHPVIENEGQNPHQFLRDIIIENYDDKKVLGRKRAGDKSIRGHTKFSDDNTRRKIKSTLVNNLNDFINTKIEDLYGKDIGEGMVRKRLMKLGQKQISNASVAFNQKFLYKKLKDIFSENVSSKCKRYPNDYNRRLINELLNQKDKNKKKFFCDLLNLTFLDCVEHFSGLKQIYCLQDLENIDDVCKSLGDDKNYQESFRCYIENFKTIIEKKKPRRKSKSKI